MRILRKALAPLAVGAALLFAAGTASADVFGTAIVLVSKDVLILETIFIDKLIDIDASVLVDAEKAAESLAVVNQENSRNFACENCAEKRDNIINSIGGTNATANNGITTVNQASGNNINQGNAIAAAIDTGVPPPPPPPPPVLEQLDPIGFAEAQAAGEQRNDNNFIDSINILFREALILDSINGQVGITAVNQGTGNSINQANVVSLAVALEAGVALSEGLLGQDNNNNFNFESDVNKKATITGSIHGNMGITQVNQSVGNFANQANAVSVAATLGGI